MTLDNRIEIRIDTELKERIAALAKELGTDSARVLRAGAAFLVDNEELARVLVGEEE